ncbi:MAG: AAA family ATPase [Candidatus Pacebacteria bacterium]|nr:AAA family ATPase [Candidatus Paceibacterota bacterium]
MARKNKIKQNDTRLTKFRVQNYRGLRDVTFDGLQPLNVIIGPNGCGKTTVLDSISFLSDFFRGNISTALEKHKVSFKNILSQNSLGGVKYEIVVQTFNRSGKDTNSSMYELELIPNGEAKIGLERMVNSFEFAVFERSLSQNFLIYGNEMPKNFQDLLSANLANVSMINLTTEFGTYLSPLTKPVTVYTIIPHHVLPSVPVTSEPVLDSDGKNLADVLLHLQNSHPNCVEKINDILSQWVPTIQSITAVDSKNGYANLLIKAKGLDEPILREFVSDGTIKILALLVLLHAPNPPPLLLIEEPENFINPRLMRKLSEEFQRASELSQLIITSHEPNFLNGLNPDQVWYMNNDSNGVPKVTRADQFEKVQFLIEKDEWLGNMWNDGIFGNDGL